MANDEKLYRDYFNIDPKYYASVTEDLIKKRAVRWDGFYPHDTFVKLLKAVHTMLSGKDSRSLWIEGAYGTGKSHAALAVKSMLEASDDEVRNYFTEFGLANDLCEQILTDKNAGKLITVHRIGSASIRSDQDLILAIQDSITEALRKHDIENKGETSLRDAALLWLESKEANREYFGKLIQESEYAFDFGGASVDSVINTLKNGEPQVIAKLMRNILKVAESNGITALRLDVQAMCKWIESIINENNLSGILFVWDEFTEYFLNNPNSLTGFQTLTEISQSTPFYFLIVTHESEALIQDKDMRRKILNRFVGDKALRIEMPENMAFRLMAQAMKETDDAVLRPEWESYKDDLNTELANVRNIITTSAKKNATMGQKTVISDAELRGIVPIHPYAALLLKHMSVAFNSNARSMFDFIISNDMTEAKGFKWFINTYGPLDKINLLTIDMLWDFFVGKDQNGLNDDVRAILDSYHLLKQGSLNADQERVFKTIILLEAISQRVHDVELLRPNEQNIDLAFNGTGWTKGKAKNIAVGLFEQGLLFEKPVGNGMKEYTVANSGSDREKIAKLKTDIRAKTSTHDLILSGNLVAAVQIPKSVHQRYITEGTDHTHFTQTVSKMSGQTRPNRFKALIVFSMNDTEAANNRSQILKVITQPSNTLFFIECLTPMGEDLLTQYVDNMAHSQSNAQSNKGQAAGFENEAKKALQRWQQNIISGAFMLYTPDNKSGIRFANLTALQEELIRINHTTYHYGIEQFSVNDTLFDKGPVGQGAECGITEDLKGQFKSANANTSLSTALKDVWKIPQYWEDPTKKSLPIVKIKQKVEEIILDGFNKPAGRISVLSIFEALEDAPFGFMPSNLSAFIMGFVLKEYANSDYFWSNGSSSEAMTPIRMKEMIAGAINQKFSPSPKFREEFIVAMSPEQRSFLKCTSEAFHIPITQCGSVESARDQIRIKMKGLVFPIWCLKYILGSENLSTSNDVIISVIDDYCGIANTANSTQGSESDLAAGIGKAALEFTTLTSDLSILLTNDNCRKGMLAYIDQYQGGKLSQLAIQIGDGGAYLDQVKQKFNSDAANWVWSSATADERISDVILEYQIIVESNKSLPKCTSLKDVVVEWNKKSNNIKTPYDVLKKHVGDLVTFLEQLYFMKQSGEISEQKKQAFYNALLTLREGFDRFYKDQLLYFKQSMSIFIEELDEDDLPDFFATIPSGQFTKGAQEYYQYIESQVIEFNKNIRKTQLRNMWAEKTGTKDPADWSARYETPILCMFDDTSRDEASEVFAVILSKNASDSDISKAISYLQNADFFDRLRDAAERDRCFKERIIAEYSVLLNDVNSVRKSLLDTVPVEVYKWMENITTIRNRLKTMADKQYKLNGCERALAVIEKMDTPDLRRYLSDMITDNLAFGMEILRNE